jgi:hypothetical protein
MNVSSVDVFLVMGPIVKPEAASMRLVSYGRCVYIWSAYLSCQMFSQIHYCSEQQSRNPGLVDTSVPQGREMQHRKPIRNQITWFCRSNDRDAANALRKTFSSARFDI